MKTLMKGFTVLILLLMIVTVSIFQSKLVLPMKNSKQELVTSLKMQELGLPKHLATSVIFAARRTHLDPDFVIALLYTESRGDVYAVSSKGYFGLLQIPHRISDPDTNLLIGAKIYKEKLKMAKGDTIKAIILYKGYGEDYVRGRVQAQKVVSLYHRLRKMEVHDERV